MNFKDRAILLGCAIGDGHVNVRNRLKDGKYKYVSSELRVVHSIAQLEYCKYKAELIRGILGGRYSVKEYTHSPPSYNGKSFKVCGFSVSNGYWKTIRNSLYTNGHKKITPQILSWCNLQTFALIYMDDGHLRVHTTNGKISSFTVDIATMCSIDEAQLIANKIRELTDCQFNLRYDKRCTESHAWYLQANTREARKFLVAIQPYIHSSMNYKIRCLIDSNPTNAGQGMIPEDIV